MKKVFKLKNNELISIIIASLLITIFSKITLGQINYVIPYLIGVITFIILIGKNKENNKKAYFYLVPIILIFAAYFIFKIDFSNIILNIIVIPILFTIFIFKLTNKDYTIESSLIKSIFSLFPNGLFSNLKYLQSDEKKDSNKVKNIILGLLIGVIVGSIFIELLASADDYFNAFMNTITSSVDITSIIILVAAFIIMFSIFININLNTKTNFDSNKKEFVNSTIVTTILSVVNFVFLLFLISEISRLTNNFLQLPVEYTYSSYAREGFFQLLVITSINFVLNAFFIYKTDILKDNKMIKSLLLLLVAFSVMLIFNSYYRMYMYISNYGFTILRLQVILFLLMELILFIVLIRKMLKDKCQNDGMIYYIITICFYVLNLYLCSNWFIKVLNSIR